MDKRLSGEVIYLIALISRLLIGRRRYGLRQWNRKPIWTETHLFGCIPLEGSEQRGRRWTRFGRIKELILIAMEEQLFELSSSFVFWGLLSPSVPSIS